MATPLERQNIGNDQPPSRRSQTGYNYSPLRQSKVPSRQMDGPAGQTLADTADANQDPDQQIQPDAAQADQVPDQN